MAPPVVKHGHCRSRLESREQHQDKCNMQLCTLELKTQLRGDLSPPMTEVTQVWADWNCSRLFFPIREVDCSASAQRCDSDGWPVEQRARQDKQLMMKCLIT